MNKKGFTLIELLAVIVVLAIILVITIPTVLGSISKAQESMFESSVKSAAKWFEAQYNLCKVEGLEAVNEYYKDIANSDCTIFNEADFTGVGVQLIESDLLKACGLNDKDFDYGQVKIKSDGRACVVLEKSSTGKFSSIPDDFQNFTGPCES